MSSSGKIQWQWHERSEGLLPQGAFAWRGAVAALHGRLCKMDMVQRARLSATATRDLLVVTGEPNDLPWAEGLAYITQSAHYPSLWLPTCHAPDAPHDLIAKALIERYGRQPLLLWPDPAIAIPLDRLLPVTPALLDRFTARWQDL